MKRKTMNVIAGGVVALSALSAHAADLGQLDLSNGTAHFGYAPNAIFGVFYDSFSFSVAVPFSRVVSTVTTAQNDPFDVDFLTIQIAGPGSGGTQSVFSFTQIAGDPFETWGINALLQTPGTYYLNLYGTSTPGLRASYAGTLTITPSVPEPASIALMLAGLGAVGAISRRQRSTSRA